MRVVSMGWLAVAVFAAGCAGTSDPSPRDSGAVAEAGAMSCAGDKGCPCDLDHPCQASFSCLSNVCVSVPPAIADGGSDGP